MHLNICLFCCIVIIFELSNASSYRRFRRQMNAFQNVNPSLNSRPSHSKTPSGSIPGTAYYGIGADPNYGSFLARPNRPSGNDFLPISYNSNSGYYQHLINPNYAHQQPYWYHKNPAWQNVYPTNRYETGNQGWYLTGDSPAFNHGISVMAYRCLLFFAIIMLGVYS